MQTDQALFLPRLLPCYSWLGPWVCPESDLRDTEHLSPASMTVGLGTSPLSPACCLALASSRGHMGAWDLGLECV